MSIHIPYHFIFYANPFSMPIHCLCQSIIHVDPYFMAIHFLCPCLCQSIFHVNPYSTAIHFLCQSIFHVNPLSTPIHYPRQSVSLSFHFPIPMPVHSILSLHSIKPELLHLPFHCIPNPIIRSTLFHSMICALNYFSFSLPSPPFPPSSVSVERRRGDGRRLTACRR